MKIKIAWLYYDLLELYGDRGNIKVLETLLNKNDIEVEVDKITLNDDMDISNHDIVFLGGGSDYAQGLLYSDLLGRKSQIEAVIAGGGFILTICGGYQLFGQYYLDTVGNRVEGLGIYDYHTTGGTNRCIGNVVAKTTLGDKEVTLVGFENHGGQTLNVDSPFATIVEGNGNEFGSQYEGFMNESFIGTYLHGPLLPKNPEIAKYIIEQVLTRKYQDDRQIDIDKIKNYKQAKVVIVKRYK